MPEPKTQSFASHAKIDPLFHYFALPVALINAFVQLYATVRRPEYSQLWFLVVSMAFAAAVFMIRTYALKVQDRLIRLEETLRMQRVLPAAQQSEVAKLTEGQFIALRFAPDAELPSLVQQAVINGWKGKDIKGAIKIWRPDHFRV